MLSNICIVSAKHPWSGLVNEGQVLSITDTHGQQAVDFLCYDADSKEDRYSAVNTVKVQEPVALTLAGVNSKWAEQAFTIGKMITGA